jgi:hypothetical protein
MEDTYPPFTVNKSLNEGQIFGEARRVLVSCEHSSITALAPSIIHTYKGRAAGKAAWEEKRQAARDKAISTQRRSVRKYRLTAMLLLIVISTAGCANDLLVRSDCTGHSRSNPRARMC